MGPEPRRSSTPGPLCSGFRLRRSRNDEPGVHSIQSRTALGFQLVLALQVIWQTDLIEHLQLRFQEIDMFLGVL